MYLMLIEWLELTSWSPYIVGAGIGILVLISFILANRPIGCSTAYARTSGLIEKAFRGNNVDKKSYYKKFVPKLGWEMMLVIGVIIGAFISSYASGAFKYEMVPDLWSSAFGSSVLLRAAAALLGGFLIGFGARMANGCTSGHGISGTMQLAVSSWIAFICFFVGGFLTALFLYSFFGGV